MPGAWIVMKRAENKRLRYILFAVIVLVLSFLAALLAGELIIRIAFAGGEMPVSGAIKNTRGIGQMANARDIFVPDDELGFRPLHNGKVHTGLGCRPNSYPADRNSFPRERLVFIGDSVTMRGKIIEALRAQYGNDKHEYWNCGVDAYGTAQELNYYLRFNRKVRPDHVILTFHNNDFTTTPIAYFDENDRLVRYFLRRPTPFQVSSWLFKNSLLYRKTIDLLLTRQGAIRADIINEVEHSLIDLKSAIVADGAQFTILLLPILEPTGAWTSHEVMNHQRARVIFYRLGLRFIDLLPALEQALNAGIEPGQVSGDSWHPSDEVSAVFAQYLVEQRLL